MRAHSMDKGLQKRGDLELFCLLIFFLISASFILPKVIGTFFFAEAQCVFACLWTCAVINFAIHNILPQCW